MTIPSSKNIGDPGHVTDHNNIAGELTTLTSSVNAKVPTTRTVSASTGLTGGGDLSANRVFAVDLEWLQDAVATMLVQGTNMTISYNDTAGTITLASSGTGGLDAEAVQDMLNTFLVEGTNVTLDYNDTANTLTINAGGGGGLDAEAVQDLMSTTLVQGSGISLSYNDTAGTLTISSSGLDAETVQDMMSTFLIEGTGISFNYSDAGNTLTINNSAAMQTAEQVQDMIASFLVEGTGITLSYNDTAGTLTINSSGGGVTDGDKGEISISSGVWSVDNNVITDAKLADVTGPVLKGRVTGTLGDPTDLTPTDVAGMLPTAAASTKGLVLPPGGTTTYLRADGTWATPAGGGGSGMLLNYSIGTTLLVGPDVFRWYNQTGASVNISKIWASVGVPPNGGAPSAIFDVNINGVSVFSGAKLNVSSGAYTTSAVTPATTLVTEGSYISVDVDQVGSVTPGAYAIISIQLA